MPLVRKIKYYHPQWPIILITRKSSEERAIAALKAGVTDYYKFPLSYDHLSKTIKALLIHPPQCYPPAAKGAGVCLPEIIGRGEAMQQIKAYLLRVAKSKSTVLITGETGTGKELIAETVHRHSGVTKKQMICVNCAALPDSLVESELFGYRRGAFTGAVAARKGKFELANHSTLFLDEIGDMSLYAQAKILRSLETNEIYPLGAQAALPLNVRVVAATNRDPEDLAHTGEFRNDLYYRLNVARIHLPPLRDRPEDVQDLVALCIDKLNRRMGRRITGVSQEAMAFLQNHSWPGNIRELNNLVEATFINCTSKRIEFTDFPYPLKHQLHYRQAGDDRLRLLSALSETKWNKTQTARKLNWSRMKVYRKLKYYKITPPPK